MDVPNITTFPLEMTKKFRSQVPVPGDQGSLGRGVRDVSKSLLRMNTTAQSSESKNPNTAAVQQWIDDQAQNHGLVDIKFFVKPSDESTPESFSAEVLEMLNAPTISGFKLD